MKHAFFVDHAFETSRWLKAFPDASITRLTPECDISIPASPGIFVWVTTTLHRWRDIALTATHAKAHVIALTASESAEENLHALQAGCRGYTHIFSTPDILQAVAHTIENGSVWVNHGLLSSLIARVQPTAARPDAPRLAGLSPREMEVAKQVAQGKNNKQVAQQLGITERTVKAHLTSVYEKLQIKDRLQLAVLLNQSS